MIQHEYTQLEEKVKDLIRESLNLHIEGHDNIDNMLDNNTLVNNWLTDIMALGFNHQDLEAASQDIHELQVPLMEIGLIPLKTIEDIRARVYLTFNRFSSEAFAFEKYVELRDSESEDAVLYAVREELDMTEAGDFELF